MIVVQVVLTIALLMVASLGPGLFFIRYLRWRPLETLCGSVALSFLLLYLAAFLIFALRLSPAWAYLPTVLAAGATVICFPDLGRLWRHHQARATMLAFLALFFWLLLFVLMIRNYSGGNSFGDWHEQFERSMFFFEPKPLDTKFLFTYFLPARPPMLNLLAAQLFWQVAPRFELFQVVSLYLNALAIFACVLAAPNLVAKTRNQPWLIAGFLALNPMFMHNTAYPWTKEFAAFYDLAALAFYLSAWRRGDFGRMVAAFACMAIAMLVHYSAAPWAIFLGAHYLLCLLRGRKHKWRELVVSAAVSIAIFSTWLGWSLANFGLKGTFSTNSSVMDSQQLSFLGNLGKIAKNEFSTLVPFPLRGRYEENASYDPEHPARGLPYWRDWFWSIYQRSFPAMLGLGALISVVWQLGALWWRPPADSLQHHYAFWFWFVFIVAFLGIAVYGSYDYMGIGFICLQPLVLLGVSMAAAGLPQIPRIVRGCSLVGLSVDAVLGVLIHFHLMRAVFEMWIEGDQFKIGSNTHYGIMAIRNGALKYLNMYTFLADHAAEVGGPIEVVSLVGAVGIVVGLWFLAAGSGRTPDSMIKGGALPSAGAI